MAGFSIEKSRKHLSELNKEVNKKKATVERLETSKDEVITARTEIEGSDISEESKEVIAKALEAKREQISEQGKEVGSELGQDLKEIEAEKQEIQEAQDSNKTQQKNLEARKAVLEKIGMGGLMEDAIGQLESEEKQLDSTMESAIELGKEAENTTRKADAL